MRKAGLVVRNGRIYTVNKKRPWAQALAADGDRIVCVGTNEETDEFIDSNTRVIDAKGRLILPGIIDSHVHFAVGYQETSWVKLDSVQSLEELYGMIKEHATRHPDYRLVGGFGWKYDIVQSRQGLPHKNDLDRVVSDRPLWLISYDGWVGLGNTEFTSMAEESLKEKSSTLGSMELDSETGEATGVFFEPFDLSFVGGEVSSLIRENVVGGLKEVIGQASRLGITSIHDAQADLLDLNAYQQVRDEGALNVRVYAALYYHRETTEEDLVRFNEAISRFSDEWLRAGAIKLFIDGVPESHTAAMLEPYSDDPSSKGKTSYDPDAFKEIVRRLDEMKFQCFVHACGDMGVRLSLDAYENAFAMNGRRDSRHRIEHIEMISQQDIPRLKQLGVIASMQPMHIVPTATYTKAVGPERMKAGFPWRDLDKSNAILAFSSDWFVADLNPFLGIHAALTRNGAPGPEQTISIEKAIEAYTINGAYASFEEDIKGSIEVSKLCDIIILSDNLFEIPTEKIGEVEVLMTIVGGKEICRSDKFNW